MFDGAFRIRTTEVKVGQLSSRLPPVCCHGVQVKAKSEKTLQSATFNIHHRSYILASKKLSHPVRRQPNWAQSWIPVA